MGKMGFILRAADCGLATEDCGFWDCRLAIEIADFGLRVAIVDLRVESADCAQLANRRSTRSIASPQSELPIASPQSELPIASPQSQSPIASPQSQSPSANLNRQSAIRRSAIAIPQSAVRSIR
jgi:hypothetical protein